MRVSDQFLDRSKELAKKCSPFANSTEASYSPATQIIQLNSLDLQDIERARKNPSENLQILELISHEWRHWHDHVGSLWGQRHLVQWHNALSVGKSRNDERQFWRIVQATQNTSWLGYDEYFHQVLQSTHASRPWRYQYTSGIGFDAQGQLDHTHPIFFVQFRSSDDHPIARVPLSVRSLLEVRAMETTFFVNQIRAMRSIAPNDEGAKAVAHALLVNESFNYIYDPYLTEYSVAAHVLANNCHHAEAMGTFRLAAKVASLALNLPSNLFPALQSPGPTYDLRHRAFIARKSFGYVYFLLCHAAPPIDFDHGDPSQCKIWLDKACAHAGLPGSDEIRKAAEIEMSTFEREIVDGPFAERCRQLLSYGRKLFQRTWMSNASEIQVAIREALQSRELPTIILGDGTVLGISGAFTDPTFANLEAWFDEVWDLENWFESFLTACFRV
jgi:hypothetical protein